MRGMEGAFAIVLFVVVGVAGVAAVWALVTSGSSYDQIGSGGFEDLVGLVGHTHSPLARWYRARKASANWVNFCPAMACRRSAIKAS